MYRCMADCEENSSLISRDDIRNCLNDCSNTLLTPKRAIVETEVNRLTNMMNRELDTCMDRSMLTMHHESYKPGKITASNESFEEPLFYSKF